MDDAEARRVIERHCVGGNPSAQGILDKLRPFEGVFDDDFCELVTAVLSLYEELRQSPSVSLVAELWQFCWYVRTWGVRPDGMLRRNNLLTDAQATQLERWIDIIEQVSLRTVGGRHSFVDSGFPLIGFIAEGNPIAINRRIKELLAAGLTDSRWAYRETTARALGVLGPDAKFARSALMPLQSDPDSDVRTAADEALRRIPVE